MKLWQDLVQTWKKSHFLRVGLPFLTFVVGGSFLTVEFQRIKYDAQSSKRGRKLMEELGIERRIDLNEEAEIAAETVKEFDWKNIRGPRPYEDSSEFLNSREEQERNIREAKERAAEIVRERRAQQAEQADK